ncbi:MAG: glycosyltransferase family 4 protein [Acidobacteriaceae bacterium]|nr:glycosyltransferase family 4 protein [Acidobacteriaceae bacterium]
MHIGFISSIKWHPYGGSEELWVQTAKLAIEKDIDVSACFVRPAVSHPVWSDLERSGVRMFHPPSSTSLATRVASRLGALSYRFGERLRENARLAPFRSFFNAKPDVVVINEGGGIVDPDLFDILRKTMPPLPYLGIFHNNFEHVPADSWRSGLVQFLRSAERLLFVADATLRATERNLATKLDAARIIRNPVNLAETHSEPWPDDAIPRFACVGALDVTRKGQDLAIQALSARTWRNRDWRLSIFGSGEHRAYLQELIAFYGLADRVELRGEVRDVRSIWRSHHALLMPSRIESAPLVIVEAMLCGRPIISTDVGGIREWIHDGRDGFLAQAATAEGFGAVLERAWERRHDWRQMGAFAHESAICMYDPAPAETLLGIILAAAKRDAKQPRREELAKAAAS